MSRSEDANAVRPVTPQRHRFDDDGTIPNNSLPFLVYEGALDPQTASDDPAALCEQLLTANGWGGTWRDGIYPFPHYHSTAHEVLAICRGEARVRFGGKEGKVLRVKAGDVVVIPAGGGHQNLGASDDFLVVGAYPPGPRWDLCIGDPAERPAALDNIAAAPMPPADPLYGPEGPLLTAWRG